MEKESNEKFSYSLDALWKSVIRPPREKYNLRDLGPKEFMSYGKNYTRRDYKIIGYSGNILQCSFYENEQSSIDSESLPVIIYCHGNSSSQVEVKCYLNKILEQNINVFAFDFSGCGKSEGKYISLGLYERKDLKIIIDFVYKLPNVGLIGLWGHSMGAATIILNAAERDPRIACICVDSPFSDLKLVLKDFAKKNIKVPGFVFSSAYSLTKNMVYNRNKVDIDKIKPIKYVKKIIVPVYFVHAMKDELIKSEHTLQLYENCGTFYKYINICEGGHNSIRSDNIINKVLEFFKSYLFREKYKV